MAKSRISWQHHVVNGIACRRGDYAVETRPLSRDIYGEMNRFACNQASIICWQVLNGGNLYGEGK